MNSNRLEEEDNNLDPVNLEIANGQTFLTDEQNQILIGDSNVEVGNSHDYELQAEKMSYHSTMTSGA
jgi:hypothetical protein